MSRLQSAAGRVPKDWSFDQWPLRRKLAAALVFPMLLAVVLGGLRVKSEFDQSAAFSAAAERTEVLRPLIEFNAAAQSLASSSVPGGPARNPATVAFDRLAQQLENSVKSGTLGPVAKREISGALSNGRALRNAVGQATAFSVVIDKASATARTTSSAVADLGLSGDDATAKTIAAIQDAIAARQAMTGQQLNLANKDDAGASIFAIGQIGAEASFLTRLKDESSPASRNAVQRVTYENYRRSVTLQGGDVDATDIAFINDGYRSSNEAYDSVVQGELQQLESTLTSRASEHRIQALINSALVLLALLAALGLVVALAKSLLGPIRRVREGALEVANKRLPEAVAKIRDGEEVPEFEPIPVTTHEEMGQLARAVDDLHKQALTLAGDQARLRVQVGHMFETLSRRSTSLIDQQLTLIENLESDEEDPQRLQSLFRLDHLAARMRRNSDSLLVLAGTSTRRGVTGAISISDAVRAAVSEVENYERIDIGEISRDQVLGAVGSDLIHLVAEVVDNALSYSPPTTRVDIRGARTPEGGLLIEVTDHGLGMPPKELAALNDRLANGGDVTADTARRMGLFVVGSLAKRHGIAVRLRRNGGDQNGITVSLHLPAVLLADSAVVRTERGPAARGAVAAAPSPVAPLAPAPPTSVVGGTTKAGLPARVRGASGATPSPVPAAAKKLPTRNPGAHGPGAPADRSATPAKPVVETAHGPAPAPEAKAATNGHANGHPAEVQPPNGHEPRPQADAAIATAAGATAAAAAAAAGSDAEDTAQPEGGNGPEARRSPAGLPVRQRNASRITEYREFEASPEPTSSEPPTEPSTGSKAAPAPKQSRLTGWLPGRKAAAEAARAEAEAAEPRQMPSNLSAWLDHRAKLAEAAKAGEPGESGQASPTDEPALSPEAAEPSTGTTEAADTEPLHSSGEVPEAPAAEAAQDAVQEPATTEVSVATDHGPEGEPDGEQASPEAAQPEPSGLEPAVPDALPTRVPGMSGSTALQAADGPAPRLVRRPLATSYFGARKAVDVEPAAAQAAVAEPATVEAVAAEPATVEDAAVAERVATEPVAAEPVAAEPVAVAEAAVAEPVASAAVGDTPGEAAVEEQVAMEAPGQHVPEPLPPAPASAYNDTNDTPIFRAMMSNWLTDDTSAASGSWSTSEADAAWNAAARTEAQEPMEESSAGLPRRRPGSHLVPGAIETPAVAPVPPPTGSRRDPETIRRNLSRHHQGVSSARTEAQDGTQREEADVHH